MYNSVFEPGLRIRTRKIKIAEFELENIYSIIKFEFIY